MVEISQALQKRTGICPRARYLYFHYCLQILQHSWKEKRQGDTLKKELGKAFWGTRGRYVRQKMLSAFVEELEHEYDYLVEGAADNDPDAGEDEREIMLAAATSQIKVGFNIKNDKEDDEEGGEDDDGDDEDEDAMEGDGARGALAS